MTQSNLYQQIFVMQVIDFTSLYASSGWNLQAIS